MTVRSTIDEIMKFIDSETEPSRMSRDEALDALEQVIDDLRARCEALRDEIAEEEGDEADSGCEDDDGEDDEDADEEGDA